MLALPGFSLQGRTGAGRDACAPRIFSLGQNRSRQGRLRSQDLLVRAEPEQAGMPALPGPLFDAEFGADKFFDAVAAPQSQPGRPAFALYNHLQIEKWAALAFV